MMLADLGADVVRIDRPGTSGSAADSIVRDQVLRSRRAMMELDLKDPAETARLLELVTEVDVLLQDSAPGSRSGWGSGRRTAWPAIPAWSTVV